MIFATPLDRGWDRRKGGQSSEKSHGSAGGQSLNPTRRPLGDLAIDSATPDLLALLKARRQTVIQA